MSGTVSRRTSAHIRLAGVGYSSFRALPYVQQFLHASPDLSLLTMHTYALTPQNCQKGGELQESSLFDLNSLQNLAVGSARGPRSAARTRSRFV